MLPNMKPNWITKIIISAAIGISLLLSGTMVRAEEESSLQNRYEALLAEVAQLRQEVAGLTVMVATSDAPSYASYASDADETELIEEKEEFDSLSTPTSADWKAPDIYFHVAGYADAGYATGNTSNDSFTVGHFAPIFHFQYKDLILFEAELEFSLEQLADGGTETEVGIEYLTLDFHTPGNGIYLH